MKEVKAFIHRGRVVDVIHALEGGGFPYLSVSDVKGLLSALGAQEQVYSMELANESRGKSSSKCSARTIRPNVLCN
jgi:nitrogen regulatory protein PII